MPILLIAWIPVNMIIILSAKPSAGIIWNAIRAALRWPLRIIGIIMFIMGAYVFYNAAHEPIGGIIGGIVDLIRKRIMS